MCTQSLSTLKFWCFIYIFIHWVPLNKIMCQCTHVYQKMIYDGLHVLGDEGWAFLWLNGDDDDDDDDQQQQSDVWVPLELGETDVNVWR